MAVWQVEEALAYGRGFADTDANGLLAKFKAWVVKSGANGGPAWFIHDDQSAGASHTFGTSGVNITDDIITCTGHGLVTGRGVVFSTSNTLPGGLTVGTYYYAINLTENTFKVATSILNAYAGTAINLTSVGSGTQTLALAHPYIVVCDVETPVVNDLATGPGSLPPKFVKIGMQDNQAGYIQMQYYMWWNATTHIGYGVWAGWIVNTYDSANFEYRFRGGVEGLVVSTRLESTWYHSGVLEWEGDANLVEATSKYGVLSAGATAGLNAVITLHSGQAANFTVGKYYFIYDFNAKTSVNYVKVTAKSEINDTITVESLASSFAENSVIASYAHRFTAFGTTIYSSQDAFSALTTGTGNPLCTIPYVSSTSDTYVHHDQNGWIGSGAKWDYLSLTLAQMAPDDYGNRAVMRPLIGEFARPNDTSSSTYTTGMNRSYGQVKNLYIAYSNSRVRGSDGLTVNTKNYVFLASHSELNYGGSANYDLLFLDTEST